MPIEISSIWRHPIKSIGSERIGSVVLEKNSTMPFDRVWALAHEKTKFNLEEPEWAPCTSFIRVSIAPKLMAVKIQVNESNCLITLSHPEKTDLTVSANSTKFSDDVVRWVTSLCPKSGPQGFRIVKVPNRGMTDTDYSSVSLLSLSSLKDLSQKAGSLLDMRRFRGNLWISNSEPYEELSWVGKILKIGEAELEVIEPIERCNATKTNPLNGQRDVDTLGILRDNFQHQNFGVYCKVLSRGNVKLGDTLSKIT
mgnify:CR=1 FL=1